jgi:hypothetical protein
LGNTERYGMQKEKCNMKQAFARGRRVCEFCILPFALSLAVALALTVLAGCAGQKPRPPVAFQDEPWTFAKVPGHKLTTEHYEIYTTLRDQVLLEALPGFVEAAYENYTRVVPPARTPEGRMKVYLFASRAQWEAFTRWFTGSRARVYLNIRNGGYSERGVSVIEYVAHQITFPLFAHEGFHQYLHHHVNTAIPAWLNEGLAVFCEGQRWGSTEIKEFDPWYNPRRRNDLAAGVAGNRLHSLRKLLETDAGKMIEGSSQSVATYYAEVWALILFLRDGAGGKYAADFQRLLASLDKVDIEQHARASHIWSDRPTFNFGEDLFRNFISEDLETVEREYFAFLRESFLGKG